MKISFGFGFLGFSYSAQDHWVVPAGSIFL